ncbi:MAG: N-acetylneuraminate synthase family protein [Candidatus Omnitrophica bacterium]|nr:N-acetylneuraminate synthase family protein [Candidatus Omnitrophota bacterium]
MDIKSLKHKFANKIKVNSRIIAKGQPVFVIAEAGVAHMGSFSKACKLVDLAKSSGASAVKFQIFKTSALVSGDSSSWRKRLASKELAYEDFYKIRDYCSKKRITFLATAHDLPSLSFLDKLGVSAYKIGSGEVGNLEFIRNVASRKKPLFLSTGMYTKADIYKALSVIAAAGNKEVIVLHCVTQYPTPPEDVNLKAIQTINQEFGVLTGYSDHTQGFHFPIAAVALGACVIEKHISLDFNIAGAQDWKVSCGQKDMADMVKAIIQVKSGIGDGRKCLSRGEKSSLLWARKSLTASCDILKGDIISRDKVCLKRPGSGIEPEKLNKVIGKKAVCSIKKDKLIKWEQLR